MPSSVRPFTPNHSIHEVAFVINFEKPLSESILKKLKEVGNQFSEELPKVEEQQAMGFSFSSENKKVEPAPSKFAALAFKKIDGKGDLKWALRAEANFLAVNCLDYSGGWSEVWPKVKRYLSAMIPVVVSTENPVITLTLQYIDKFIYEGTPDSYQSSTIFDTNSKYLSEQVTKSGPYWHLHQGWFIELSVVPQSRFLNRLNLTAAMADQEHLTTIDHSVIVQFKNSLSNAKSLFEREIGDELAIDYYYNKLHIENKSVLKLLLNEERIKEIKLN
jgi:uncharacterized protein (TIGR04255 family)